ncbi:MAG: nitroreductase family protein [Myxococcales bacterium]|nr:nitroreductase family protein [Myxococcales bacterium]
MTDTPDAPALSPSALSIEAHFTARRSVRAFKDLPVPRALIEQLVSLAITAPSASNKQPWRFVVVRDPAVIAAMARAVRREIDSILENMDPSGIDAFRAYGEYFTRFERAPCVIAPTCRATPILSQLVLPSLPADARARIERMELRSAHVSTALALENLLLAAPSLGLGASALTGPLVAAHELSALLELPGSWELLALVAVGYPDEEPRKTERKPAAQVLRWIGGDRE